MQRRKFLRRAALLPLPFLLGGGRLSALTSSFLETAVDPNDDRVLVLLQLNGGNDGLSVIDAGVVSGPVLSVRGRFSPTGIGALDVGLLPLGLTGGTGFGGAGLDVERAHHDA